jgi:hypothetical protein
MNFWELAYDNGWATKEQLGQAVELNDLTVEEYQQITGEEYVAPTV